MENKNDNKKPDKFGEAVGLFWGASLFIGALTAVIIGFTGDTLSDWLFAGLAGGCVFLACGLLAQGVISLVRKDS